jgi:ferrochelatase
VSKIKDSIEGVPRDGMHILFSAHSLPQKVIDRGDPYKRQTETTVRLVMEHFRDIPHTLAYQSKVGFAKWLEPSTDKSIEDLAKRGVKTLVVVPISFVSEHSETLYELDIQYRELAKTSGIGNFLRVPTLQKEPLFIKALASLIKEIDMNQNKTPLRG